MKNKRKRGREGEMDGGWGGGWKSKPNKQEGEGRNMGVNR